ncbi:jmjd6-b, partial [Symbiodinium pilosum]
EKRMLSMPRNEEAWSARGRRLLALAKRHRRPTWREQDWQAHAFARLNLTSIFVCCMDNIERVNVHDEKYTDFGQRYQKGSIPVLISGAMSRWPAMEYWKLETFAADFGHQKIICDHRFGIRMRFDDFRNYMEHQEDDTPLYLFDHAFGEYPSTRLLVDQYKVPDAFRDDLLADL